MKNNDNAYHNFVKPVLVLVIICFVVTFALAFVYGITKPIIDENTMKAANEARTELLADAEGKFTESDAELVALEPKKVFATDCYVADNGSGMVVTVQSNSYGGLLTAMVGIDKDGAVTAVKITAHADTPGVGTKAQTPEHLGQYKGYSEIGSTDIKADSTINHVSGASISSGAVHKAVCCALEQYKSMQ
ncbi:MAG: FMN-binding protein [Clostridiales bacterium]|nr:FMN-binding protein [Candidatus Crickella merdequi]